MNCKNKILLVLLALTTNYFGQNEPKIISNSFKEYKGILLSSIRHYGDSISKKRGPYFFTEVYISEFDTILKRMKITHDYSLYNPLSLFNPTHIDTINNIIVVFRFGKKIDYGIIRKFTFKSITEKLIKGLEKEGKRISLLNHQPTYSSQPFVFELRDNEIISTWYPDDTSIPLEDRAYDSEYLDSGVKYEVFFEE